MNNNNDALIWKNKYLELLDQQVQAEVNFNEKTNLLKRALIRSSLAAEGHDQQLDQQLQILRTLLRKNVPTGELEKHINQLDKAVLQAEESLQHSTTTLGTTLTLLVQQLQQLQPSSDVLKELRSFEKNLDEQLARPQNVQSLLMQLTELQGRALQSSGALEQAALAPTPSFFARLFKATEAAQSELAAATAENDERSPVTTTEPTQEVTDPETEPIAESNASSEQLYPIDNLDDSYTLPHLKTSNYSSVAKHIHQALTSLLNDLPVSQDYQQQVLELRSRINQGLNWYELAPLLEDLSSVVLSITNGPGIEQYLLELKQRSKSAYKSLQATTHSYTELVEAMQNLESELHQHIFQLHNTLHNNATDLSELKAQITDHLDSFMDRLRSHQASRTETDSKVFACFASLKEHSKQMEQAARSLSSKPKAHRQRTLIDSLTGLANQAAWDERLELEYERIQRNHSSLLLGIIEIDHFKDINTSYGHLAGDKVLRLIAQILQSRLRRTDFIARCFASEQFSLLLPETPLDNGCQLLNELRTTVANCPFRFKNEPVTITFTASIGQLSRTESTTQVIERIEQSLSAAKDAGHNQVITAQ